MSDTVEDDGLCGEWPIRPVQAMLESVALYWNASYSRGERTRPCAESEANPKVKVVNAGPLICALSLATSWQTRPLVEVVAVGQPDAGDSQQFSVSFAGIVTKCDAVTAGALIMDFVFRYMSR